MKKQNEEKVPDVEKEGWSAEELSEEATNKESDEIVRELENEKDSKLVTDSRDEDAESNSEEE